MVYEAMIPFCPSGAGGCHETEMAVGPSTSPAEFKGGDDGAVRNEKGGIILNRETQASYKLTNHLLGFVLSN